jgi:hypothetical protein
MAGILCLLLGAAGCGRIYGLKRPGPLVGLSMTATVVGVTAGRVALRHVVYHNSYYDGESLAPSRVPIFRVPQGRWVSGTHWQGIRDSLDLFKGEEVGYYFGIERHAPSRRLVVSATRLFPSSLFWLHGIIVRRSDSFAVITYYDGSDGTVSSWRCWRGKVRTTIPSFRLPDVGDLRVGDEVILGLFGPPAERMVWQATILGTVWPRGKLHLPGRACLRSDGAV